MQPIDFKGRVARAFEHIRHQSMLVMAQPEAMRNSDVEHRYRQESFLYYLTGFDEPGAALLLVSSPTAGNKSYLFLRERDPLMELWNGRRLGVERAPQVLAIDEAKPISALWNEMPELLVDTEGVYFTFGQSESWDRLFLQSVRDHARKHRRKLSSHLPMFDLTAIAGEMRLRKGPEEVARMRKAAAISSEAFRRVFKEVRPGMNEREVYATLTSEFLRHGSEMQAYESIVAGGANACCLHYAENNAPLRDGELLLIDAGAQFDYYASDVTRTFPIGKKFSHEQKALYEIVLAAQEAALKLCHVGSSIKAVHDAATRRLVEGLVDIKLLQGNIDELISSGEFKRFYPHGTSHWLGMDVHDIGTYLVGAEPLKFGPGMVLTVEPGLYVQANDEKAQEAFRGIGIRIEDDVHITKDGHEILTAAIPKSIADMEGRF